MIDVRIIKKSKGAKTSNGTSGGGSTVNLSTLYAALDSKLDSSIFDDLFEKVNIGDEENPKWAIRAKYGLFSNEFLSVLGVNDDAETSGGSSSAGVSELAKLLDVSLTDLADGDMLVWDAASKKWVNRPFVDVTDSDLEDLWNGTEGGITGAFDEAQLALYLTQHGYATQNWVHSWVNSQNFLKSVAWSDITDKPSWIGTTKPTYAWSEITGKPTTLSGFGITDAYTKTEIENLFVKKTGDTMTGLLTANAGISIPASASLKIGDAVLTWDANYGGCLKITTGLYSEQWLSVKGANSNADQGSGGLDESQLAQYLTSHGYATQIWVQTWIQSQGYLTASMANSNYVSALGVSGNYLTWTKNGTINNITVPYATNALALISTGQLADMKNEGKPTYNLYLSEVYGGNALGFPVNYGNIINVKGSAHSGSGELLLAWSGTTNAEAGVYYRNNRDSAQTWSEWKKLAFITDNIASATRLQTTSTYTAWGQTFFANGVPQSVTGSLSNVTDINMSGSIYINDTTANSSIRFARAGVNYLWATGAGSGFAFISNGKTKEWANAELVTQDGFVYPGTNNATSLGASAYRWSSLYAVMGNFSGAVTMSSTLSVAGLITAQSGIKIGDGTITWDSSYGGFRFSHGLYSEQWVSVKGVNNDIGSGGSSDLSSYLKCGNDGVVEGGRYFDFHSSNWLSNSTEDYTVRLDAGATSSPRVFSFPTSGGVLATQTYVTSQGYITSSALGNYALTSQLASYLALSGGTMTGGITFNDLGTTALLSFSGNSINYIHAKTSGGMIGFVSGGNGISQTNCTMLVAGDSLSPGSNNKFSLGFTTLRWSTVYGVLGNFSSAVSQNTSDLRLKTDIRSIDCLEILGKIGNVFSYRYNTEAVSERDWLDTTTIHYGIAYQNAIRADIPGFTGTDEKGYGWVNFLSSDMLALILGGVMELSRTFSMYETRLNGLSSQLSLYLQWKATIDNEVDTLKKKVRELEEKIAELEAN